MLLAAVLLAQAAPAQCTAMDSALPAALAGWTAHGDLLESEKAVTVQTVDRARVAGLPAGAREGGAAEVMFRVENPGVYGVALDQAGWIDVVPGAEGGAPLASIAHGHGPDCSTIRKIVRYRLEHGVYRVYLTGLAKPQAKVMLVPGD